MINVEAIPILQDNYVWAVHNGRSAILVDPGQAGPILAWLKDRGMIAQAILVTHHHNDHVGGIAELLAHYAIPVYGPARGVAKTIPARDGKTLSFAGIDMIFDVFETPGHTLDHVCYVGRDEHGGPAHLFCGDTLFSVGSGRLFEGTPAQMYASLTRLAELPGDTQVCCAHEYTLDNIAFALEAEPDNADLQARHAQALALRKRGEATLPVSMAVERGTNPFLRCDLPGLVEAASQHFKTALKPGTETFAAIRTWKDET
ncbi:MAG: hydroxyacylglutathione hydrolase [Hydrogenophilales bacterium 28-61-23]|nr:MAG: hydroxyacylglutathione hydrolase [Hydrogenophilales bacterium 28-61-23]